MRIMDVDNSPFLRKMQLLSLRGSLIDGALFYADRAGVSLLS
jgi:hypothetical protein